LYFSRFFWWNLRLGFVWAVTATSITAVSSFPEERLCENGFPGFFVKVVKDIPFRVFLRHTLN